MSDIKLPDGWSVASCFEEATPTGEQDSRYGVYVHSDGTQLHSAPYPYSRRALLNAGARIVWCVRTAEKWNDYPLPETVDACDPEWYADQFGRKFAVVWNHRAGSFAFVSSAELANGGGLRGRVTPVRIKRSEPTRNAPDSEIDRLRRRFARESFERHVDLWQRMFGHQDTEKATPPEPSPAVDPHAPTEK